MSEEMSVAAKPAAGSILGQIHAGIAEAGETEHRDIRVGKVAPLYARYVLLDDDEREDILNKGRNRKMRRKGASDGELTREQSALLLVRACEMLLVPDEDAPEMLVPLHEQLGIDHPLVYNAETVEILDLREVLPFLSPKPSAVEIVTALHRWGRSHAPLTSTARLLDLWMQGVDFAAAEEMLEGS